MTTRGLIVRNPALSYGRPPDGRPDLIYRTDTRGRGRVVRKANTPVKIIGVVLIPLGLVAVARSPSGSGPAGAAGTAPASPAGCDLGRL
ncbi:hypothetical protein AB0M95_18420 [Sphaerisporangium sp. NPDC051017]|uniref:hypothetical protein n=1 Tax=Sphaerisporangium sp. NPDC051017 TaxID=3154636 RepID=UPI00344895D0